MRAWHPAQAGSARCCTIASRNVSSLPDSLLSVFREGTVGGGGGGGEASRFSSTDLPRNTGDVRGEYDVRVIIPPWPRSTPRRVDPASSTRRNWLPRKVGMP